MDQARILSLWTRHLAGKASPEETEELEWALQQDPDLRRMAQLLAGMRQAPPKGISAEQEQQMLERGLQHFKQSQLPTLPVMRRISTPDMPPPATQSRRLGMHPWIAAASLLAVIAGMVFYLHLGKKSPDTVTVISAPRGAKKFMQLSDGSKLWLNAGSRIVVSSAFAAGDREITLEGEAFLDVRHDKQHPFVIHAGRLEVRVLGTELNVRAYPGDTMVETTLINGKVEVGIAGDAGSAVLLHPNEKLTIAMSHPISPANGTDSLSKGTNMSIAGRAAAAPVKFFRRAIEPDKTDGTITETSWVSNKLVFRQETLSVMATRLERWYDMTIVFDNQRFQHDTLSGTFPQESLADVMHALQITAGFHYRIDKDTVRIW